MAEVTFRSDVEVRLVQQMGGDHMVAAAARVSTSGEDALALADPAKAGEVAGLIRYLMNHRHGTPFEHSALTFFVRAPIFVWREWHRHRIGFAYSEYGSPEGDGTAGMSFNEESARYKTLDPVFYVPDRDRPMLKVEGWKPGRPKFLPDESGAVWARVVSRLKSIYEAAYVAYEANLADGIDPGLARDCLPVGIYSSCWVTCNPRSLMAFLGLRTHDPTAAAVSYPLHEIELAARTCEDCLKAGWPLTHRAFVENGRVAP